MGSLELENCRATIDANRSQIMRVSTLLLAGGAAAYKQEWITTAYTNEDVDPAWLEQDLRTDNRDYAVLVYTPECMDTNSCSKPVHPLLVIYQESFTTSEQVTCHFFGACKSTDPETGETTNYSETDMLEWAVDELEYVVAVPNGRTGGNMNDRSLYRMSQDDAYAYKTENAHAFFPENFSGRYYAGTPGGTACIKGAFCGNDETQWFDEEDGNEAWENFKWEEAALRDLVETVDAAYSVDRAKMYVTGGGGGGFLPARWVCDAADLFAASYVNTGMGFAYEDQCQPSEPMSVLYLHYIGHTGMPYYGTDVGFTERDGTPIDGTMFVGMKDQTCIGDWCLNNIKSPPAWYSTASPVDQTGTYDCDPYSDCLQEDTYYSVPGMLEECATTAKYMFFPNAEEQARRYFRLQGCDDVTIETETRDGVANIIPDCYNDGYMECDDKPKTYWYNVNFESVVWGGTADESSFMHYVGCFGYCESLLYPAIANMWGYFVGALSNYIMDPPERTFELNLAYNNGSEYPEVFDGTGPETEMWEGKNCDNGVNVEFYKIWGQETSMDKKSAGSYLPYNWTSHSELVFNFFEANPKTIACSTDADCPSYYVCDGGARRKLRFGFHTVDSGVCVQDF